MHTEYQTFAKALETAVRGLMATTDPALSLQLSRIAGDLEDTYPEWAAQFWAEVEARKTA